jgi:predicted small lipoprotein YifL
MRVSHACESGYSSLKEGRAKQASFAEPGRQPTKSMLPPRYFKLPVIVAILMALLFAGCGKKGSLYLPDSPSAPDHKQPKN